MPKKKKLHYGYIIVVAGFLTQVILVSSQHSLGLTLVDIQETLGVSFAEVGLLSSYYGLVYAGAAFIWGWLSDRFGPRKSLTCSGALASIGLFLFGLFGGTSLTIALITYTIVGFGCAGIFLATLPKLIAAWFVEEKRGHALRFVSPGGAIASMVLGVVMPLGVAASSWQTCYMVIGVVAAVVTTGFFFLLRDDPSQKGLTPVGSPPDTPVRSSIKQESGATLSQFVTVLKKPLVWHLGIMYIIYQLAYSTQVTYYVTSIRTSGYSPLEAGLAMTISSFVAIFFMQLWGPLSDRLERKSVLAIGAFGSAIVAVSYFFILQNNPNLFICYLCVALMQGFYGITPVFMAAFADYFPGELRGTASGVISTLSLVGRYGGPFLSGLCIDAAGGRVAFAFIFSASASVVAGGIGLTWPRLRKKASEGK
ncbi:MAG: MFS transporter [Coriobacteriia bacterium]|nr:MFS transporter [Coriobacteriia bacterium]